MCRGCMCIAGVSNYGEHHLDELLASATVSPSINQVEVSPFNQRRNLLAYCAERSIPVQAWGSLTAGQQLRPPRNAPWPPGYAKEKARSNEDGTSPVLVQVAREAGCTVAQVLLRWGLQKGLGVLPRSRHPPHIKENWAARYASMFALPFALQSIHPPGILVLRVGDKHDHVSQRDKWFFLPRACACVGQTVVCT